MKTTKGRWMHGVAAGVAVLALTGGARADTAWYSSAFAYRTKLTIQHTNVTATLTNFPVLVNLTGAKLKDTANGGHVAQTDGGDVLFTKADGVTKLNHEIESYAGFNGALVAWVKVDELSASADTDLYMYYGNEDMPDQWNAGGVWDSQHLMVQHLQGTNTAASDSTTNARDATLVGGCTANVAGQANGAVHLDGSGYLSAPYMAGINNTNHTISLWYRRSAVGIGGVLAGKGTASPNANYEFILFLNGSSIGFNAWQSSGMLHISLSTPPVSNDTDWHQVVYTANYGAPDFRIYVDGVLATNTTACIGTQIDRAIPVQFGLGYDWGYFSNGDLDEIQVSSGARSPDWIATSYNNQKSPAAFVGVGAEEGVPGLPAPWYSGARPYRTKVVVLRGAVAGPLTNFPVLISGTRTQWRDVAHGGHVGQADAGDILFTKADGVTKLNHEIESYSGSNGALVAWVAADALSTNAEPEFYMYYGDEDGSNQWNAPAVWDSHHLMVQHLQGTNTTALDSTVNARNGSLTTGATPNVPGQMNGAVSLSDTVGNAVSCPNMSAINNASHTISLWFRSGNAANYGALAGKAPYEFLLDVNFQSPGVICYTAWDTGGNTHVFFWTSQVANDTNWHHVAYTADYVTPAFKIYVDGVVAAQTNVYSGTQRNTGAGVLFGSGYQAGAFLGDLDELRISDTPRAADWIKTSYNLEKNPAATVGFCREEPIPTGSVISIR
ncbi:MAG: DUF2341 domain-containing protein [Kiritimatiellae bacterium]|nr:DUF2341 domain-containing protein [Kiritimatiellia bacterium]